MPNFNVQAKLFKQCSADGNHGYFIHVITYAEKSDYRENGHAEIPMITDSQGIFHVDLLVRRIDTLPDFTCETPITHTLNLGQIPIDELTGKINISVFEVYDSGAQSIVGDSIVNSADADEDIRPIKEEAMS